MTDENIEIKSDFGNLTTFYSLLYTGAAFLFIGLALIFTDTPEIGLIFIFIASILIIVTFVIFYIILYRVWKFIIDKEQGLGITPSIPSAGQAIGFLLIPLFNIYWIFKAFGKLPVEINLVAKKYNVQKTVQDNLGYIIGIFSLMGLIPIIGYITVAINFLILLPLFITRCVEVCELIVASDVTPDRTTEITTTEKIEWQSIKEFSSLFDNEEHSINYFIGIALFISLFIIRIIRLATFQGFEDYLMPEFDYFINGVAIDLIISVLFVFTCYLVKKNWLQPFVWGVVIAAVFYFRSIIFMNAQLLPGENIIKIPSLNILELIKDFTWGFAFMFGFVFAINIWGAKIWSLIVGLTISYVVYKSLYLALGYGPTLLDYNYDYIFSETDIINLFGRIITALLLFGGLFVHFDNLQSKKILQKTVVD
ncbi:MAG: hypothetical protein KJO59_04730 [Ignavibacteria bacterium]|nr:hypothetical protein [Ignavibacteria bacterium]